MAFRRKLLLVGAAAIVVAGALLAVSYRGQREEVRPPAATFGGVSLHIELATTTEAQERGLGGRPVIPDDYGMLFVFKTPGEYGFWMKDMLTPIDMFWLDAQGHVVSMQEDVATSTYPDVFYPPVPALYVLETAAGFGRAHHIGTGSSFVLQN